MPVFVELDRFEYRRVGNVRACKCVEAEIIISRSNRIELLHAKFNYIPIQRSMKSPLR